MRVVKTISGAFRAHGGAVRWHSTPKGGAGAGTMGFYACTLNQVDRADIAYRLRRYLGVRAGE